MAVFLKVYFAVHHQACPMDRLDTGPPAQVILLLMRVTKVTLCLVQHRELAKRMESGMEWHPTVVS